MSNIMHRQSDIGHIAELKESLYQYGLDFTDGDGGCNDPLSWIGNLLIFGIEPKKGFGEKVRKELAEQFKFKHIAHTKDEDYEHAYSVIEVKGSMYKLEIDLSSGEGISSYTDFWAWTLTRPSTKTINVYE